MYFFLLSKMQNIDNSNEWVNWIEDGISRRHIKYYGYNHFSNFQEIGYGAFGIVYRANWKNLEKPFTLKSFFNFNNVTVKEIVNEVITKRSIFGFLLYETYDNIDFNN